MIGVEIDMVVSDSLAAYKLYEKIFETQCIEVTDYDKGLNEAVFSIYDTKFHLLDENVEYMLMAPKPDDPKSMWMNVVVLNIQETFSKAIDSGCKEIQPITEMEKMGVINAMFSDPFGYIWMLHQIVREVSFEERCQIMEEEQGK